MQQTNATAPGAALAPQHPDLLRFPLSGAALRAVPGGCRRAWARCAPGVRDAALLWAMRAAMLAYGTAVVSASEVALRALRRIL